MKTNQPISTFLQYPLVIATAALMSVAGAGVHNLILPRPPFGIFDLILPSCLTWLLLSDLVKKRTVSEAAGIGILSCVVGAAFAVLFGSVSGIQSKNFDSFIGGLIYGTIYVVITFPITLPVGILTSLIVRRILSSNSRSNKL